MKIKINKYYYGITVRSGAGQYTFIIIKWKFSIILIDFSFLIKYFYLEVPFLWSPWIFYMFIFLHGGLNYDKILRVKKDLRILHFILSIFNNSIRLKKQIIISIILRTQIQRHCTEFQNAANCSDCIFIFRPFQIKKTNSIYISTLQHT